MRTPFKYSPVKFLTQDRIPPIFRLLNQGADAAALTPALFRTAQVASASLGAVN